MILKAIGKSPAHGETRQGGVGGGDIGQTIHLHLLVDQCIDWVHSWLPSYQKIKAVYQKRL